MYVTILWEIARMRRVAGYDNRIRAKYTAKLGVQIAGMIFQTRLDKYRNNSQYNSHSHLTKAQKYPARSPVIPPKYFIAL